MRWKKEKNDTNEAKALILVFPYWVERVSALNDSSNKSWIINKDNQKFRLI